MTKREFATGFGRLWRRRSSSLPLFARSYEKCCVKRMSKLIKACPGGAGVSPLTWAGRWVGPFLAAVRDGNERAFQPDNDRGRCHSGPAEGRETWATIEEVGEALCISMTACICWSCGASRRNHCCRPRAWSAAIQHSPPTGVRYSPTVRSLAAERWRMPQRRLLPVQGSCA